VSRSEMRTSNCRKTKGLSGICVAGLATLVLSGCGQEEATVPPLAGPSTLALSIDMQAVPSILNADGASTSTVTASVHDADGRLVPDQVLFFTHDGDGLLFATGSVVGPLQTGVAVATDGNGSAQLVYQAGTEPGRLVSVWCEPYSRDATSLGGVARFVVIQQR
jgi:hypothetical protein